MQIDSQTTIDVIEAQPRDGVGLGAPPCSALIEVVTMYRTTDGKLFHGESSAIGHQEDIEEAKQATARLEAGSSLGEILQDVGRTVTDEILFRVTKDSKLVVSHWQCRDTPGYRPIQFKPGMSIYVFGDAGSWSGPYGDEMTISELIRYAKDSRSILGQNK